jgi:hypothetical protein
MTEYTVTVEHGTTTWRNSNGELHRDDGPAIEHADGGQFWYQRGELHRDNGPAVVHAHGTHEWYQHGLLHRDDGPAYENAGGYNEWYLNGTELSEAKFNQQVNQ